MTRRVFFGVALLVFGVVNAQIMQKELVLRTGRPVLLELAPVDPRSLMQGDYMVLDYQVGRVAHPAEPDGHLVLREGDGHVARFVRVHDGRPLAADELLLRYRQRGRVRLGAESFFFQEGHAKHYEGARYGELRVTASGDAVLVGLRDAKLRRMGPA